MPRLPMPRSLKRCALAVASLLGLLIALSIIVLLGANTAPGRALILALLPRVTSGSLHAAGLSGRLPGEIRLQSLTLSDPSGPWLTARDVSLQWRPLALLEGRIVVRRITAKDADLLRLPAAPNAPAGKAPLSPQHPPSEHPTPLVVQALSIARLRIAGKLAGRPLALSLAASGERGVAGRSLLQLSARALDGESRIALDAVLTPERVSLTARVDEPANGLIASLAGLDLPGPLRISARLSGPRSAISIALAAHAGPLSAHATGKLDLPTLAATLTVSAISPALAPLAGISWQSLALSASTHGPLSRPQLKGSLEAVGLHAEGATIGRLALQLSGSGGKLRLSGRITGLLVPGPAPDLFASAPFLLDASALLDAPGRPVTFTLRHPLLEIRGKAETKATPEIVAALRLPELAPLARPFGVALTGSAAWRLALHQGARAIDLSLTGGPSLRAAPAGLLALLGTAPALSLAAEAGRGGVTLSQFSLRGSAISLSAHGRLEPGPFAPAHAPCSSPSSCRAIQTEGQFASGHSAPGARNLSLAWKATLPDLALLQRNLAGSLAATGTLAGPLDRLALAAALAGRVGYGHLPPLPWHGRLQLSGFPAAPAGTLTAGAELAGAPLTLRLAAREKPDGVLAVTIDRARWKSAESTGTVSFSHAAHGPGRIAFRIGRLADLSALAGFPLSGSLTGSITSGTSGLTLHATGSDLVAAGIAAQTAALEASVADAFRKPRLDARLRLENLRSGRIAGDATISLAGPPENLALRLEAHSDSFGPTQFLARASVDVGAKSLVLTSFSARFQDTTARLIAPAKIVFAPAVSVSGLRLGIAGAGLSANGEISPRLGIRMQLRNAGPTLFAVAAPGLPLQGRLDAEATFTGSFAAPQGTLQVNAIGLGLARGPAAGLPRGNLTLSATLASGRAHLESTLVAGAGTRLAVSGTLPLAATAPLALALDGNLDLALVEPALAAEGRRVAGHVALHGELRGTLAAPEILGRARLDGGLFSDYRSGLRLSAISLQGVLSGGTLALENGHARAGPGTISFSATIGLGSPGLPVALALSADNAELLQSDLITLRLDSALSLSGTLAQALRLQGRLRIREADIKIPESLPPDIAVLHVVRPGSLTAPVPAGAPRAIALDVAIDAPGKIFLRGRGVDAEFGGRLKISGSVARPEPVGVLHLIRGRVSLAGRTLTFTSGAIGFNGGNPADPTLDLVATTTTPSTTATLKLGGTVEKPTVELSSVPVLPPDQVLAALLFGAGASRLGPLQLAGIAGALASLSGAGPRIGNPLGAVRKGLGLSQLGIGTDASGRSALQAGRYVAPGVYVGASQSTAGHGSQAQVTIDLTQRLKLNATVGNGAAGNPNATHGSSVGLTWQFEY